MSSLTCGRPFWNYIIDLKCHVMFQRELNFQGRNFCEMKKCGRLHDKCLTCVQLIRVGDSHVVKYENRFFLQKQNAVCVRAHQHHSKY